MAMRLAGIMLAGCLLAVAHAPAVAQSGAVPVILIGDDGDAGSLPRDHDVARQVIGSLRDRLRRDGFEVVDEEMIAVEKELVIPGRRGLRELSDLREALRRDGDPRFQAKAVVVFRMMATAVATGFSTRVSVRLRGELFDASAGMRRLVPWEVAPRESVGPATCDAPCVNRILDGLASDVAASAADALRARLAGLRG